MNQAITTVLSSIAAAQVLKIPTHYLNTGEWKPGKVIESGGMPSSHSSAVTSLMTYVGLEEGIDSPEFAISTLLGLIVMYDARGVRRHAGKTAVRVNHLDEDVEELAGEHPGFYHEQLDKKLKENLGHQNEEVLGGALLGIAVGAIGYMLSRQL